MARRRMISQDMISDEHFNALSLEAQNVFLRMLSVSDDCGVVPASAYRLNVLINTPKKLEGKIGRLVDEIVSHNLGHRFEYCGAEYFAFKQKSFAEYQSYILNKATKSEYLRIPKEDFERVSSSFQEVLGNSGRVDPTGSCTVESRKQKVEGREKKEERPESFESVQMLWKERGYPDAECEKFYNHYQANGWRVGKNPMKDWRAAAAGWILRSKEYAVQRGEVEKDPLSWTKYLRKKDESD